jgi:group II intron reverse transcriptase/maturase
MEDRQGIVYQLDMFVEHKRETIRQSEIRKEVDRAKAGLENQVIREGKQGRTLVDCLMERICSKANISTAYKQVKRNKGVAGVDNMAISTFKIWYNESGEELIMQLLRGEYEPQGVKQVEIPKASGGMRKLGIPTVTDRIIQQAISQVLSPMYEKEFSEYSYGFRPNRGAHDALKQGSEYVKEGRTTVVDMDMKSFFDEVNHDKLMYKLSRKIGDKNLLGLIRKYLRSGVLKGGIVQQREKGTPQGSPLSPLLSNIVLDDLDKELERRGHSFVRYADDFSIFVSSQKAGERVKESISKYLTEKLKLRVNEEKSKVCKSYETKFLGYTIQRDGNLGIAKSSLKRFKMKIRAITKRNRGRSFEQIVSEVNLFLRGWLQYFRLIRGKSILRMLDGWIRRKLRCYRIKQSKKTISLKRLLHSMGVPNWQSWIIALSGKGHWRKSGSPQVHQAFNLKWFEKQGLYNLSLNYKLLNN